MARLYKGYIPTGAHWQHVETIRHNKQEWLLYFNNETSDKNWREYKLLAKNRVRGTANYFFKYSIDEKRIGRSQAHLSLVTKRPALYDALVSILGSDNNAGMVRYCQPNESQKTQFSRYDDFKVIKLRNGCIYLLGTALGGDGWVSFKISGVIDGRTLHTVNMSYNVFQMRYAFLQKMEQFQKDHPEIFAMVNTRIESQIGHKTVSEHDRQIIKSFDLGSLHVELLRVNAGDWVSYTVSIKSGEGEKTFCCARNVTTGELSQAKITGLQALQKFNELVYYQVNKTILGIV